MADLILLSEYKAAVNLAGSSDDGKISAAISYASDFIGREYEREFIAPTPATATRRFRVDEGAGFIDLTPYDLRSLTSVMLHPESSAPVALGSSSYQLAYPANDLYGGIELSRLLVVVSEHQISFGYALADVTGTWGFPSVPASVKRGCIEFVRALVNVDPGQWAAIGDEGVRDSGSGVQGTYAIPASARRWLDPFRRYSSIA